MVLEINQELIPVEIKSGQTLSGNFFKSIHSWQELAQQNKAYLFYAGNQHIKRSGVQVLPWNATSEFFDKLYK